VRTYDNAQRMAKLLNCGIFGGLLQAGVFNPWDRALYLSVSNKRPFLLRENFANPMAGVLQTITQRAISAGLYFPLEEIFTEMLDDLVKSHETGGGAGSSRDADVRRSTRFVAGLLAGSSNGLLLNPFSSVKFYYWGKAQCGHESFIQSAVEMYRKGGFRPFFVGSAATIHRDLIFGGFYALVRHEQALLLRWSGGEAKPSKMRDFGVNVLAASVATVLSSPLNYVRVVHYATPPDIKPVGALEILRDLLRSAERRPSTYERLSYIQTRLRIGWGTARVGFGMGFSSTLYGICSKNYG